VYFRIQFSNIHDSARYFLGFSQLTARSFNMQIKVFVTLVTALLVMSGSRYAMAQQVKLGQELTHPAAPTPDDLGPRVVGTQIFSDSGSTSLQLFFDSTRFGSVEIGEIARSHSWHYVGYSEFDGPGEELIEEQSTQKSTPATSEVKDGKIILTAYRNDISPPRSIGYLRWRDTIIGNEIRYDEYFIEASTYTSSMSSPPGSRERTLYRYADGMPFIDVTSDLYVVEDPMNTQFHSRFIGYLNTNAKFWNTPVKFPPPNGEGWTGIGSDTFAIVSYVDPASLKAQYLVFKPTDDANDLHFHADFSLYEECTSLKLIHLKRVKRRGTEVPDINRNDGHWVTADPANFEIEAHFEGLVDETVRIPIRNGKMQLPHQHSKWFKFAVH
jgi:hypothetical protein